MALIATLPALCKLAMELDTDFDIVGTKDAAVALARRAMPHLEELDTTLSMRGSLQELVDWGLR